jgi:protein-tyrosine-phosphatase/predicted ATP-grasp superfamily ATP-dependent carboligase
MFGAANARLDDRPSPRPTPLARAPVPQRAAKAAPRGPRVLVLGEDTRAFLAVVRSLGRRGCDVHAAPSDFTSPALQSRHISQVHRLPPYSAGPEAWVAALQGLIACFGFALILPCTDQLLIPLYHHADAFSGTLLALPNREAIAAFFDKLETRSLAEAAGVPIAKGRPLGAGEHPESLAAELGLPLALKPRQSYRLGQASSKSAVQIVRQDLAGALARIREPGEWFAEAYFEGEGVGLSVLAREGEIVMAFQHRRLHEASESGGSSSRVSEAVDARLLAAAAALARAVRLHGVAMFEFRRNARGDFILLEVNARFWGSLPLALAAGADFPAALCDLWLDGRSQVEGGYRTGVVRRALSSEYYRIVAESEQAHSLAGRLAGLALGLSRLGASMASPGAFDSHAPDDPAPWRRERRDLIAWIFGAIRKRLPDPGRRRRARRALTRLAAAVEAGNRRVIVLCHGNICRSPFAARLLARKAQAAGVELEVISAGTIPLVGRRSPREAVAAARAHRIDLEPHRSACLAPAEAETAAAVLVFDNRNLLELRRIGARRGVNLLRLGDLIGRCEVEDPYGGEADAFADCYADIEVAVQSLVEKLVAARASR